MWEVVGTSNDYNTLIPAWYLEQHKARGTTTSHEHFPHCSTECCGHGKIHPNHSVPYEKRVVLTHKVVHIGAIIMSNPTLLQKSPAVYPKFLLLFDPEQAEILPDNTGCDHRIE